MKSEEIVEKKEEKTNPLIGLLIIGFFVILLLKVIDWGFLKSEITEYPVQCKEKVSLNRCNNPYYTLGRTTYKVLPNRQEVLYWNEAISNIEKLTKCAVKDRKNWSCKYNDESAEFGFRDGQFWHISAGKSTPIVEELTEKIYYVSRLEYLNLGCKSSSSIEYLICLPMVILFD